MVMRWLLDHPNSTASHTVVIQDLYRINGQYCIVMLRCDVSTSGIVHYLALMGYDCNSVLTPPPRRARRSAPPPVQQSRYAVKHSE